MVLLSHVCLPAVFRIRCVQAAAPYRKESLQEHNETVVLYRAGCAMKSFTSISDRWMERFSASLLDQEKKLTITSNIVDKRIVLIE